MKKAFTLIELIVTIAVIAALASFGIGQYSNVTRDASLARVKSDLKTVRDAVTQYLYKTEHIPVNNSGLGLQTSNFNLADGEYVMVNLELLANKQLLEDGAEIPASLPKIPVSARYSKSGVKNTKKQEPSFIYVMDNNINIYLAEAKKDKETGYFIHTKIYETANANLYDEKVKMSYEGNKPILENISTSKDNNIEDSTIIKDNIQINPDLGFNTPSGGGNSGIEDNSNNNKLYYKNLSVAGFTVFLDMYDMDLSKIKSVNMEITAGSNKKDLTLYAVKSTRWFGRVNAEDLNNYSGNYNCKVYAITKENKKVDIESFDVLVDRTKPTLTISKSKNDFYSENPIKVTITAKDPELSSGIKRIEYKLNNSDWKEYKSSFTLSEADYYEIQAKAIDNFGNESTLVTSIINDYTKPEVYLTKTSTGVSINLGVDVANEDILWQNGFETTDKSVTMNYNNTPKYGKNGGQSITTEDSFEGSRAYKLLKNDDGNGNIYFTPNTSSNTSRTSFGSLSKTITNNMYLALVYRYKSYGDSTLKANLDGGWARKIKYYNNTILTEDVPAGSKVIKLNSVANVKPGNHVTSDTDAYSIGSLPRIEKVDTVNNTITLTGGLNRTLTAGEKLAYRDWRSGGSFATNNTSDTDGEWRLFTSVTKTNNYDDYDLYEYGSGNFLIQNTASNKVYIDNVKMGFASRMILYKNRVRFNTANQEYTTSYVDNDIPDKAKPAITNVSISSYENNFNIEIQAKDVGTQYTYYMESISRGGKVSKSKNRSITTTSGIKQFYYTIDNNPSTSTVPTTQKTSDYVINKTLDNNKSWYIHIVAEDEAGNKSSVYHKQIV